MVGVDSLLASLPGPGSCHTWQQRPCVAASATHAHPPAPLPAGTPTTRSCARSSHRICAARWNCTPSSWRRCVGCRCLAAAAGAAPRRWTSPRSGCARVRQQPAARAPARAPHRHTLLHTRPQDAIYVDVATARMGGIKPRIDRGGAGTSLEDNNVFTVQVGACLLCCCWAPGCRGDCSMLRLQHVVIPRTWGEGLQPQLCPGVHSSAGRLAAGSEGACVRAPSSTSPCPCPGCSPPCILRARTPHRRPPACTPQVRCWAGWGAARGGPCMAVAALQ
jgi:hypothetical protein